MRFLNLYALFVTIANANELYNSCFPCVCIDSNTQMLCEGYDITSYPTEIDNLTKAKLQYIAITQTYIVNLPDIAEREYSSLTLFSETNNYIIDCNDVRKWHSVLKETTFLTTCFLPVQTTNLHNQTCPTTTLGYDKTDTGITNTSDLTELTTEIANDLLTITEGVGGGDDTITSRKTVLSVSIVTLLSFTMFVMAGIVYMRRRKQKQSSSRNRTAPIYRDPGTVWLEMDQTHSQV